MGRVVFPQNVWSRGLQSIFCEVLITLQVQVQISAMQFFKDLEYLLLNKRSICKQLYSFIFLPITCAFSIPEPWLLLCFSLYILLSCNTVCVRDAALLDLRLLSSSCAPSNCHSMPWGFPSPICLKSLARCYLHCVTSIMRKCGQIFIM